MSAVLSILPDAFGKLIELPGVDMTRFGKNIFGDPLYRIVWGPSRRHLAIQPQQYVNSGGGVVLGSGAGKAHFVVSYPHAGDHWVLEAWMTAFNFTGMTPVQWENSEEGHILGGYPTRGDYVPAHVFWHVDPLNCDIQSIISLVEKSRGGSAVQNRIAIQDEHDRREKDRRSGVVQMLEDACRPFDAVNAFEGYGTGRKNKTIPLMKSANELGLPTQGGSMMTKKARSARKKK